MIDLSPYLTAVQANINQEPQLLKKSVKQLWTFALGCILPPNEQEIKDLDRLIQKLNTRKTQLPQKIAEKMDSYCRDLISQKVLWTTPANQQPGHRVLHFNGDSEPLVLPPLAVESLRQASTVFDQFFSCSDAEIQMTQISKKTLLTLLTHLNAATLPDIDKNALHHLLNTADAFKLTSLSRRYTLQLENDLDFETLYKMLFDPKTKANALEKLLDKESPKLFLRGYIKVETFEDFFIAQQLSGDDLTAQVGAIAAAILLPTQITDPKEIAHLVAGEILKGNATTNDYMLFAYLNPAADFAVLKKVQTYISSKSYLRSLFHLHILNDPAVRNHSDLSAYPEIWEAILWNQDRQTTVNQSLEILTRYTENILPYFKIYCQYIYIKNLYEMDKLRDANPLLDFHPAPAPDFYYEALILQGDFERFQNETKDLTLSDQILNTYYVHLLYVPYHYGESGDGMTVILNWLASKDIFSPSFFNFQFLGNLFTPHNMQNMLFAIRQYREIFPNNPFLQALEGVIHEKEGGYQSAIEAYTRSLEKQKNPGIAFRRGCCYYQLKEFDQAETDLKAFPNYQAAILQARIILHRGEGIEVAKNYLKEQVHDPKELAHAYVTLLLEMPDQLDELLIAVNQLSDNPKDQLLRAAAYQKVGDYKRALDSLITVTDPGYQAEISARFIDYFQIMPATDLTKQDLERWKNAFGETSHIASLIKSHILWSQPVLNILPAQAVRNDQTFWTLLYYLKPMLWDNCPRGDLILPETQLEPKLAALASLKEGLPFPLKQLSGFLTHYALKEHKAVLRFYQKNSALIEGTPYRACVAEAYRALGEPEKAWKLCLGENGDSMCDFVRAQLLYDNGNTDAALPFLKNVMDNGCLLYSMTERAQVLYDELTGNQTEFSLDNCRTPEVFRAMTLRKKDENHADLLSRTAQLYPENKEVQFFFAEEALSHQKYHTVSCLAAQILREDASSPAFNLLYAISLYHMGKFKKAIPYFEAASNVEIPNELPVSYMLGECYHFTGQTQKAYEEYEKVDHAKLQNKKELAHYYWKRMEAAKELGIEIKPIQKEAREIKIKLKEDKYFEAMMLYRKGDYYAAISILNTLALSSKELKWRLVKKLLVKCLIKTKKVEEYERQVRLILENKQSIELYGSNFIEKIEPYKPKNKRRKIQKAAG